MSLPQCLHLQSPISTGSTLRPKSGDGSGSSPTCCEPRGPGASVLVPFRWTTRPPRTPRSRSLHPSSAARPSFLAYWPYPILNCLQFQPFVSISEIHLLYPLTTFEIRSFSRQKTIHSLPQSAAVSRNEVHYLDHPGIHPGSRPGWQRCASCSSPQDSHSLGPSCAQQLWCCQFVCSCIFPHGGAV